MFSSKSSDWMYLNNSHLILLLDSSRLDLGELERDRSVGEGYVLEQMSKSIPLSVFNDILNAKNVEGKLFMTEFKLSTGQLSYLINLQAK